MKETERERLLVLVPEDNYVIALAIQGKAMSSESLAEQSNHNMNRSYIVKNNK